MAIPVFLSYPTPHVQAQADFVAQLGQYLRARDLEPRTLGVNEWDNDAPLTAIRRLMLESNGVVTVAFRRLWVEAGATRRGADVPGAQEAAVSQVWYTSPWCHIEPAMAFQLGLPVVILRERGVVADGVLEKGIVGMYMPEFSLDASVPSYLQSKEWSALIAKWEGQVREVREAKGRPPRLYG